jgi:hypothetical protein
MELGLNEPILIVGDLNLEVLQNNTWIWICEKKGLALAQIHEYNIKCPILGPTRVADCRNKITVTARTSRSLIDVIIHDKDLIDDITLLDCAFSDKKMLLSSIKKSPCQQKM